MSSRMFNLVRLLVVVVVVLGPLHGINAAELRVTPLELDANGQPKRTSDLWDLKAPVDQVVTNAARVEPNQLLILSIKLHDLGRQDEALFWFFVGLSRSGLVTTMAPDPNRSMEFAGLLFTLGAIYQPDMVCDPKRVLAIFDRAMKWDEDNEFDLARYESIAKVPKAEWPLLRAKQRKGLLEIRSNLVNAHPQKECPVPR
jgi:hypothetical protein